MNINDNESDSEVSYRGLDTSDESVSSSEYEYSSDNHSDEELLDGRNWFRLDVSADNMNPAPPTFSISRKFRHFS